MKLFNEKIYFQINYIKICVLQLGFVVRDFIIQKQIARNLCITANVYQTPFPSKQLK